MFVERILPVFYLALCVLGCGFIDLRTVDVTTCPDRAGAILGSEDTITLTFSMPVEKNTAEALLRVTGPEGVLEGDFRWEGNTVRFTPLAEPVPGYRYTFSFRGEIKTAGGASCSTDILLPFYYFTDSDPPLLTGYSPGDAEVVGPHRSLVLTFNRGMDRQSVEDSFTLRPGTETLFTWNSDSTGVTVLPRRQWTNLQFYTWTLSPGARDTENIPVPEDYHGSFLVQLDTAAPVLLSAHPAFDNEDGTFTVMDNLTLDDLTTGEHIALTFSEEIDFSSLTSAFSLAPPLEGYLLSLSPDRVLYYLTERIPPGGEYALTLRQGLEDTAGNPTAEEVKILFSPGVRPLEIHRITIDHAGEDFTILPVSFNLFDPFLIPGFRYYGTSPDYFQNISIELSQGFGEEEISERKSFAGTVSLLPLFPPGAVAPDEYSISWMSDTVVQFQYRNLSTCTVPDPVYYRLKITGGNAGAANADGSYLPETVECTFRGALE